jgi:hypothetical protein
MCQVCQMCRPFVLTSCVPCLDGEAGRGEVESADTTDTAGTERGTVKSYDDEGGAYAGCAASLPAPPGRRGG